MHHQDFSGESAETGGRKMSHTTGFHHRRGSSGASSVTSSSTVVGGSIDNVGPAESLSPGLHHQLQSQATGAQVKKKSGFQITSVISAQSVMSSNNSLADDTESYDDMDESHTEDLSSSDMLDVSVSRATDTGVPERSSSDETLNSLHGVDTPGLVSPNEPLHAHSIPQGSQQVMNGALHHHHHTQPQSHSHHLHGSHHSDNIEGAQLPQATQGTAAGAPVASSSPALIPKAALGPGQSGRTPVLDSTITAVGVTKLPTATIETLPPGNVSIAAVSASNAPGLLPSGPTSFDNSTLGGQGGSITGGTAPVVPTLSAATNTQTQHTPTQAAAGSRFRVVKLDTNSEPFRKGRWMCTEYYEKEIPQAATSEALKGTETTTEIEPGVQGTAVACQGPMGLQPPQTLQPYSQPCQDFISPQAMQSPPQGQAQNAPLAQVPPQEASCGVHLLQQPIVAVATLPAAMSQVMAHGSLNQPPPVMPQQLPYAVDSLQPASQVTYPAPQLEAGVVSQGGGRQPDFIQPTAPFQTQVQPPLPHVMAGVSVPVGLHGASSAQPPAAVTQQLPQLPLQAAPSAVGSFTPAQPQPQQQQQQQQQQQIHPQSTQVHILPPSSQGVSYVPLTALQADLQPLLIPGAAFLQTSVLGQAAGGVEASALMAAAAGLRSQPAEGEEDSSSGASVVAIDNKIEQAMDLVKSHLMYAVREEVEVLKEHIKELIERNSQLEQENNLLKAMVSPEQMAQFQAQVQTAGSPTGAGVGVVGVVQPAGPGALAPAPGSGGTALPSLPSAQNSGTSA